MAWEGLTEEGSLHPSFEQGFRFPAVLLSLLQDVQASPFPIFGLQVSALFKLLLAHEDAVGFRGRNSLPFSSSHVDCCYLFWLPGGLASKTG